MMLISGISGSSQPIDSNRDQSKYNSCGYSESKISGVGE